MRIHDWTSVGVRVFHNFHVSWIVAITDRLNGGLLPAGFFAMLERSSDRPDDVRASDPERYALEANRIAVHCGLGNVVAVIELVSPGNKDSDAAIRTFAERAADLVRQGVNVLVVDMFPPGPRDPQGIHKVIWDEIADQPFEVPPGKPLPLTSYQFELILPAYIDPATVGDRLPDMPLFLVEELYVNVPLEQTYQAAWDVLPGELRRLVEGEGEAASSP